MEIINFTVFFCDFVCTKHITSEGNTIILEVMILIFQSTVIGVAGLMCLGVLIRVVEEQNIESECVAVPVRDLVVNGVLETQQNFKAVTKIHVQVNVKVVYIFKHLEANMHIILYIWFTMVSFMVAL